MENNIPLESLDFSPTELFARTFRFYFIHLPFFAKVTLAVYLPLELVRYLGYTVAGVIDNQWIVIPVDLMTDLIFGTLSLGAVIYGAGQILDTNTPPSFAQAMCHGFKKWWRMFLTLAAYNIGTIIFAAFLVIPGLIFAVQFMFVTIIACESELPFRQIYLKSRDLTAGRFFKLLAVYFLAVCGVIGISVLPGVALYLTLPHFGDWTFDMLMDLIFYAAGPFQVLLFLRVYRKLDSGQTTMGIQ